MYAFLSTLNSRLWTASMTSLSIDYLFNRIYDVLLWIKYVWLFVLLRKSPDEYLFEHTDREFDGLRDRGWFDQYLAQKSDVPLSDVHVPLWQKMLEFFGYTFPDSDGDGIADVSDPSPYDSPNLSEAQLKERYESDYTFMDHLRDLFGIGPADDDNDSVPNSYETSHGLDPKNPDTDMDGMSDGRELLQGGDPLNSDTDGDLVLDGRDAYPTDSSRSIQEGDTDSDGDGVGDSYEALITSDPQMKDTDGDGIPDNMDTYPADATNVSHIAPLDIGQVTEGLHFAIQNPMLALFSSLLSILALVIIAIFVYAAFRWFLILIKGLNHYDHHFHHDTHRGDKHTDLHIITNDHDDTLTSVPNLPLHEDAPATPPTAADFADHPRFAIVQGYMSSQSEALWRIGIMEADNMLAIVLKEKGYEGETVADMLKNASFKTVQLAWDAHGVRNRIAHEGSDFELTEREAKRAFGLYESVFRELKVIR